VPLPGDVSPTTLPKVSGQAALQVVGQSQVSAGIRASSRPRANGDDWFVWLLALTSLAVPTIVLVCVDSIPKDALAWHLVGVSVDRGDFLIPGMALCLEAIRRWWRDVSPGQMKALRLLSTVSCAAASLVCVIATTTAASLPITSQAGSSIATITCSCLVVGVSFGTAGLTASGEAT
jgi:hypothetical protein